MSTQPYRVAEEPWAQDKLGNHRAVVAVDEVAAAVWVRIHWRRRDRNVDAKRVLVAQADGVTLIHAVCPLEMTREAGVILFHPVSGAGIYYVYFLPYGGNVDSRYPRAEYLEAAAADDWLSELGLPPEPDVVAAKTAFPEAICVALESVNAFHRFTEMERPASPDEVAALLDANPDRAFLVFAETAENVIRMRHDIPVGWAGRPVGDVLSLNAGRGEFVAFQLGVFAAREDLGNVQVAFADLKGTDGSVTTARMRCFNQGGVGWDGVSFEKRVDVSAGDVQAMWCGLDLGEDVAPGHYQGLFSVSADTGDRVEIPVHLEVSGEAVPAHGDDEPERMSRLRWLDSQIGNEDSVFAPFEPVRVEGRNVRVLGRELVLAENGLPEALHSFFAPDNTCLVETGVPILAGPMSLVVDADDGKPVILEHVLKGICGNHAARADWRAESRGDGLQVTTAARIELDGCVEYTVRVQVDRAMSVQDMRLDIPFEAAMATYMVGLGRCGGRRPCALNWRWDVARNQDCVWLGGVNGGLQVQLKDDRYARPLNTNFYHLKPLVMPDSWCNHGRGGIRIEEAGGQVLLCCYSGARRLEAGQVLHFNFRLLLTPFKLIDTTAHFQTRYYHAPSPVSEVIEHGGNVVNIHHANEVNPWINYPFLSVDTMRAYIDAAHAEDVRVKLYYTVRELTTRAPELFALQSLNGEVIVQGEDTPGHAWLQEHLEDDYIAAWFARQVRDTSVINGVLSRWHNFYVEGMDWLARNLDVDGLYLDDIGFGREVLKRIRRVLSAHRPKPELDLHSANQYRELDGFAGSLSLYMDCLPFLDRLWLGEYFDYGKHPDYWLTEVSGIPFGLMGEMLQDGGNRWRGMVFGMTGRAPRVDNRALWTFWDEQGLSTLRMHGFWVPGSPVRVTGDDARCTVYAGDARAVLALANWSQGRTVVSLDIDWDALGLDAERVVISQPAVEDYQAQLAPVDPTCVALPGGKGCLLVIA